MKINVYPSAARGYADFGWLKARYCFSFANYNNPSRLGFGKLVVLNEDRVAPGRGFPTHPHDNMEIVTIALAGGVEHKDSMGNAGVIRPGEIQAMSAGTGIMHSEANHSKTEELHLYQIWVTPREEGLTPGYAQRAYGLENRKNRLLPVVSYRAEDGALPINQDVIFLLGNLAGGATASHTLSKKGSGIFVIITHGSADVEGKSLSAGDSAEITGVPKVEFTSETASDFMVIETPL